MKLKTSLLILTLLGLVACQGQKEVVKENNTVIREGGGNLPAPPQSQSQGGVDGGGGNGVEGKPIESFSFKITDLPEYQSAVSALISELRTGFPNLAADFLYISSERTWYLVPISLNKIPSFKIGAYFPTDQLAYQTRKEVWIDKNLYDKLTVEQKQKLIVHELLMGVRILEQSSTLEKCLAKVELITEPSQYKTERHGCMKNYKVGSEVEDVLRSRAKLSISQEDYGLIRKITNDLLAAGGKIDGGMLSAYFEANNFRIYSR